MRNLQLLILASAFIALGGCKAIKAMDNTTTMKDDLSQMKDTTGGMAGTTASMEANMKELKRKATLGEGLKLFNDPINNKEFAPPAAGLLAGAKLLAENMTNEEMVDFFLLRLKEINTTKPDAIDERQNLISGFTEKFIYNFNKAKKVKVLGLQALAAQIPLRAASVSGTASIEGLIREQLQGAGGARSDEVLALLQLRAMFIQNFFLDANILADGKKLNNLGKLRKAYGYAKDLQFIAELPFVRDIAFKTDDFAFLPTVFAPKLPANDPLCDANRKDADGKLIPVDKGCLKTSDVYKFDEKFVEKITPADNFFRISSRIKRDMPDAFQAAGSAYAREISEIQADCDRLSE